MSELPDITIPKPAIVIAVGEFAVSTAVQAVAIYERSDSRRSLITKLFSLTEIESGAFTLTPLTTQDETVSKQSKIAQSVKQSIPVQTSRQMALQKTIKSAEMLRIGLNNILHDIRSHELLIKGGWSEVYDIPVNIYLVADIKDPVAAGAILPLACLLQDVITNTSLCKVHALLNTAVFPRTPDDTNINRDVDVYTFLLQLDDVLQHKSRRREKLIRVMGCESPMPPSMTVYLFDSHKKGSYEVENNDQMRVMVGNALLALMEADMARHMAAKNDAFEPAENSRFYSSIGATVLAYDPDSLQCVCAQRCAYEYLKDFILGSVSDAQKVVHETEILEKKLGGLYQWMEACVIQLSPDLGQIRIDPDTCELSVALTNIKLTTMVFDRLRDTPWVQQLKDCAADFQQNTWPQALIKLSENAKTLESDITSRLNNAIESFPTKPELYPAGLQNAMRILKELSAFLAKETVTIAHLKNKLELRKTASEQEFGQKLERLQKLFDRTSKIPWLIRILPSAIRTWAVPTFYIRKYGRQLLEINALKVDCSALLQSQCAAPIQVDALDQMVSMLSRLMVVVENAIKDYQALEKNLNSAKDQLPAEWPSFPLGQAQNGWFGIFRFAIADKCLAEWSYAKWRPSFDQWVYELANKKSPLLSWRSATPDSLADWFVVQGKTAYTPLFKITLDDVFQLWNNDTPGFSSSVPLSSGLIAKCIGAAFPLLRPDFDSVGGSSLSALSTYGLIGQSDWKYFKVPPLDIQNDKVLPVITGDPFTAVFMQIIHATPLESLVEITRSAKHKLSALPENKKREYEIIPTEGELEPPTTQDTIDPTNPDVIQRKFRWKFTPKGTGAEIEESISLDISRSRFEQYKSRPRFKGEWNRYAEEEMPEIRSLALGFQNLHANKNWSTYNQAFNVLKFVQSCMPYSFDKDTTGHEDWARYPIETCMESTGDCEDVAILCAAVIARLGFQVVLLRYPKHIAFGVAGAENLKGDYVQDPKTSMRYFYGEATADGWHLGEIPKEYLAIPPEQILPVKIMIQE